MAAFDAFVNAVLFNSEREVQDLLATDPALVVTKDEHGFTALHILMSENRPRIADALIKAGADVHARNDVGMTPLHLAQSPGVIEVLLTNGADINATTNHGQTPLHIAASESYDTGSLEVMAALLEAGADPHRADASGRTPMSCARSRLETAKLQLLAKYGAVS